MINGFGKAAEIEAIIEQMKNACGGEAIYHPADMTKPSDILNLVDTTVARFGTVDILVNNAGIQHVAKIEEFPAEKWDQIIAVTCPARFIR